MRVVIVGGGIGGLAAALSLHAVGIKDVVIAEAAPEIRPLGVGINLLPHAARELTELGLADQLAARGVATAELAYFNRYGQAIWSEPRGIAAGYHWPQYSIHRGELQLLLLAAVRERLGQEAVRTGRRLTGLADTRGGAVALFGTEQVEFDLLIGADGIRSTVRSILYPDEGPPPWNGLVLWRGTTVSQSYLTGRSMIMAGDGEEKFVAYPISSPDAAGNLTINWIAERPMPRRPATTGDWNRSVPVGEVLSWFGGWRFDWLDVATVIGGAEVVYEYPMADREPLPQWTFDRVVLLGDAAHAMYPIGSNGASQAILDGRVLACALAEQSDPDRALAAYEADRRPVTTAIQRANRQMGPESVLKLAHERAPRGFDDIDEVIPLAERQEIAMRYKQIAGFDPAQLNERPGYGRRAEHATPG